MVRHALALCLTVLAGGAIAQPVQVLQGPTILDTGSAEYQVDHLAFPGPEGGIGYAVDIAWPKGPAPEIGYRAVYALDGRAVGSILDADFLAELAAKGGVAIVAIGYDRPDRFAMLERTRDYTPPGVDGEPVVDPRGRVAGHAPEFLRFIVEQVIPAAESVAPLDPAQRTLWGHSYGGLFVLHAASSGSTAFARYVSASPSLWWDHGSYLERMLQDIGAFPSVPLHLHVGGAERERASRPEAANARKMLQMRDGLRPDALRDLSDALREADVPGGYVEFPGLSHGESFAGSLRRTLRDS